MRDGMRFHWEGVCAMAATCVLVGVERGWYGSRHVMTLKYWRHAVFSILPEEYNIPFQGRLECERVNSTDSGEHNRRSTKS
ncbi:hypothetical protein DENSPDRAFT_80607 [Dentipellis sp. KUC8613]|nr:hypothetical protein DENSPDRAFT_80607 [Dentipellis sp. KUC8613]